MSCADHAHHISEDTTKHEQVKNKLKHVDQEGSNITNLHFALLNKFGTCVHDNHHSLVSKERA